MLDHVNFASRSVYELNNACDSLRIHIFIFCVKLQIAIIRTKTSSRKTPRGFTVAKQNGVGFACSHSLAARCGSMRRGIRYSRIIVDSGVLWCGVEWCGAVWCDVVWCGVV